MLRRSSRRNRRSSSPCTCLLEAFRTFPADAELGQGCASADCPVRAVDRITLHRFLEAIGRPDSSESMAVKDRALPIIRAIARRLRRR
jgi:hypothetical protein